MGQSHTGVPEPAALGFLLTSCVNLSKFLNLSMPDFLLGQGGMMYYLHNAH